MIAALTLSVVGIALIFVLGRFAERVADGKPHREVRKQLVYQPLILTSAFMLYGIHRLLNAGTSALQTPGDFTASAQHLDLFGIPGDTPWSQAFLWIAAAMFSVTTLVVFLQVVRGKDVAWRLLPIAFLFSLIPSITNALSEEIIFRFIAIEGLSMTVSAASIALLCGVWFGLPHYFGSPGKIPGVLMAGFLGWILAWATIETSGVGAAWFIHFVQDVPIFTIIFLQGSRSANAG